MDFFLPLMLYGREIDVFTVLIAFIVMVYSLGQGYFETLRRREAEETERVYWQTRALPVPLRVPPRGGAVPGSRT